MKAARRGDDRHDREADMTDPSAGNLRGQGVPGTGADFLNEICVHKYVVVINW